MTENSKATPYQLIGGQSTVISLVDRFYFYMDILPEAEGIRKLHATDLGNAKDKLYKFLSGWLGGPDLYIQEYGHPMLRRRHFPFAIGQAEKDQWMLCMRKAMNEMEIDAEFRSWLLDALDQLAAHMINQ